MSLRRILGLSSWATILGICVLLLSPGVFRAAPQNSGYRVIRSITLGGEGGWDYVTVDPDAKRIYIFDLKTLKVTSSLKSNSIDTDSLMYDPNTKRVFVNNGDGASLVVVDAATEKVVGTMPFNANPEAAVADGKGSIFNDLEDKGQVMEYDAKTLTVKTSIRL